MSHLDLLYEWRAPRFYRCSLAHLLESDVSMHCHDDLIIISRVFIRPFPRLSPPVSTRCSNIHAHFNCLLDLGSFFTISLHININELNIAPVALLVVIPIGAELGRLCSMATGCRTAPTG